MGGTMKNKMKLLRVVTYLSISMVLTLIVFYMMSWYSFNTLPTILVFLRMVLSTILLTVSMVLISMTFERNRNTLP